MRSIPWGGGIAFDDVVAGDPTGFGDEAGKGLIISIGWEESVGSLAQAGCGIEYKNCIPS